MKMRKFKDQIEELFKGVQYGVGEKHGIEKVIHSANALLTAHPELDLLAIDQANAFNSLIRQYAMEWIASTYLIS